METQCGNLQILWSSTVKEEEEEDMHVRQFVKLWCTSDDPGGSCDTFIMPGIINQ